MLPTLFKLGPFEIGTHDAFVFAGLFAALTVFLYEARRRNVLDERLAWIAIGSVLTGAVAAKASTVWQYVAFAPDPSVAGAILYGGKSILGGLAGAYAGAIVTKRIVGYRESTGDVFAPAVALGLAVGRIGCFLTEQVGTPTSLPWGIAVDSETASHMPMCRSCLPGAPMHPSYLYEVIFQLAMFGVLLRLRPVVSRRGELFKIYLASYAVFRFIVEFVRGNPAVLGGLSYSQLFLIPTILAFAAYFLRQRVRGAYRVPSFADAPSASS